VPGSPTKKSPQKRPPNRDLDHHTAKYWKDHDQPDSVAIPIDQQQRDELAPKLPMMFRQKYPEPRESYLNEKEQKYYLRLMNRFSKSNQPGQDPKGFNDYTSFRELVNQEQTEYATFANEMLNKQSRIPGFKLAELTPEAKRYSEEKIKAQLERVRNLPRQYYPALQEDESMLRMMSVVNEQQASTTQYEMRFASPRPLLELGSIPKVCIPPWGRITNQAVPLRLDTSYSTLNQRFPTSEGSEKSLSEDANAQKLGRRCKPDVVIGIKALQYIFASELNAQEDWIIPLNVVKFDEKIVYFIEDPLIMCSAFTVLEKNRIFAEAASKDLLLKSWDFVPPKAFHQTTPKSKSNNGFQSQRSVTTVPAEVQDNMFDNDIFGDSSDLETFGQGSRVDGGNDTDSEEERGLIIDTNIHESTEDEDEEYKRNVKRSINLRATRTKGTSSEVSEDLSDTEFVAPRPKSSKSGRPKKKGPITKVNPETMEIVEEEAGSLEEIVGKMNDSSEKNETSDLSLEKPSDITDEENDNSEENPSNEQQSPDSKVPTHIKGSSLPQMVPSLNQKPLKKRILNSPNFLDGLISSQNSMLQPEKSTAQPVNSTENAVKPEVSQRMKYHGENVQCAAFGNAAEDYEQPGGHENVNFRHFFIRPKDKPQNCFNMIIKGSTDGLWENSENGDLRPFTVQSKVETQLPFGLEKLTSQELAFAWMATLVRPNSVLAHLRSHAISQDVIAVETKELNDMTREGFEDGNFNPAHSLGNIYNLIFGLSAKIKEEGQYLLKRDGAKNGAFVQVLSTKTSSTGKRPFDLHAAYSTINADEDLKKRPIFRPLDFKCITPFNVKYGRVPGLFEPKKLGERKPMDSPSKRGRGRGGRGGRGRGRGGRGRSRSRGRGGRGRGNN